LSQLQCPYIQLSGSEIPGVQLSSATTICSKKKRAKRLQSGKIKKTKKKKHVGVGINYSKNRS